MMKVLWLFAAMLAPVETLATPALENEYFKVTRNTAVCAAAGAENCGDRVIVALAPLELRTPAGTKTLKRGEIAVFGPKLTFRPAKSRNGWMKWKKKSVNHQNNQNKNETIQTNFIQNEKICIKHI